MGLNQFCRNSLWMFAASEQACRTITKIRQFQQKPQDQRQPQGLIDLHRSLDVAVLDQALNRLDGAHCVLALRLHLGDLMGVNASLFQCSVSSFAVAMVS